MDPKEAEKIMLSAWADFIKEPGLPPDNFPSPGLGRTWIRSIITAVEEEREACARILDEHQEKYDHTRREAHSSGFTDISIEYSHQAAALSVAAREIRARAENIKTNP